MDEIEKYFSGERAQCIGGIIISALCIALAIWFLMLSKPLFRGVSYVFIIIPVLLITICTAIVIRTPKDIERVTSGNRADPGKTSVDEHVRMDKVMKNFIMIKRIEAGLFVTAILLMLLFRKNSLVVGIGAGLAIQTIILYIFDFLAKARGKEYMEYLKSIA